MTVCDDHWRLDNLTANAEMICYDLEDHSQRVRVSPGRVGVVMPFELALVGFHGQKRREMLTVFAHEPSYSSPSTVCSMFGSSFLNVRLDPDSICMAVLKALCEFPAEEARLPTSTQIARELSAAGRKISRRAVDHHIDYLFRKFYPDLREQRGESGWKREAVARAARRAGIISSSE